MSARSLPTLRPCNVSLHLGMLPDFFLDYLGTKELASLLRHSVLFAMLLYLHHRLLPPYVQPLPLLYGVIDSLIVVAVVVITIVVTMVLVVEDMAKGEVSWS